MSLDELLEILGRRWLTLLLVIGSLLWPVLKRLLGGQAEEVPQAPPPRPKRTAKPPLVPKPKPKPAPASPSAPAPSKDPWAEPRREVIAAVEGMDREARALSDEVEHERPNRRFVALLREWIPERAEALLAALRKDKGRLDPALMNGVNVLSLVMEEAKELIRQRRDGHLAAALGDADTLADACYQPIITFAEAEGLPLATARPATQLTTFDLSIWTGFAPTSIAPIFLPPDFFRRVVHWPAVAHEIGHSFLVSVRGLELALREELQLPGEDEGTRAVRVGNEGIDLSELRRLFGGWFEEAFSDVFGTMMCGPAYVATMVELFAARNDPREVLAVPYDPRTKRYDVHPPRHLRVHLGCRVLDRAGLREDAKELWARWLGRNGFGAEEPVPLLLALGGRYVAIPFDVFTGLAEPLVERLYAGPLRSLSGVGLHDVSGLDYGPRAQTETIRARDALLAGRVPRVRDARQVIGGAVLAWVQQPELEAQLLALARAAIPALGTGEQRPDAYQPGALDGGAAGRLDFGAGAVLEAFLVREILEGRGGRRRAR